MVAFSFPPRQSRQTSPPQRGITLIEMLVFMALGFFMLVGAQRGAALGGQYGPWGLVGGMIGGALLGGVAFVATVFALYLPFGFFGMVRRILEPADLVCRCEEPDRECPENLAPQSSLAIESIEESLGRHTRFRHILLFQLTVPSEIPGYVLGTLRYRFAAYLAALALAELPYAIGTVYLGSIFLQRQALPLVLMRIGIAVIGFIAFRVYRDLA